MLNVRSVNRLSRPLLTIVVAVMTIAIVAVPAASHGQTLSPPPLTGDNVTNPQTRMEPPRTTPTEPILPSIELIRPKRVTWNIHIEAQGNIQPWQEVHISSEVGGLRVLNVLANTGDTVKKGQTLARLNATTVESELDTANAQLVEAKAALAQAAATLERANRLAPSGGVSKQELTLYETQKHTAEARLTAARALVKKQQARLDLATIVAPDDGILSSRSIAEGAIVQSGSELFRIIRQGRLQWRAEVGGEQLLKLAIGQEATVKSPLGETFKGQIRQISPTIDPKTQKGWAMVDLPSNTNLKAGLSVSGELTVGHRQALVLPTTAVLIRDGASQVFRIDQDNRIAAFEVKTGDVRDGLIEVVSGLDEQTRVVSKDLTRMQEGETVGTQEAATDSDNASVTVR